MTFVILFLAGYALVVSVMVGWFAWWCHRPLKDHDAGSKPRPDYGAIARMEREIYGEADARSPSLLCPCGGRLPQHIRSPHYLPGYDAAGRMES